MTKILSITKGSSGGGGAPTTSQYVTLALDAGLSAERVLTGTANQVILADGGANGNIVLSTPQNINTAAAVQFGTLQLPAGSAAAPPLFFTGALTTGLYGAGTNQLGVAVNGALAMQMNSTTSWGWHGSAPTTTSVITSAATATSANPPTYWTGSFTYSPAIGASSSTSVLIFDAISTKSVSPITGLFYATIKLNNPSVTCIGLESSPRLDATSTMASGTLNLVGFDNLPGSAGNGTVSGGTVNIIGFRMTTIPSNYAGGGATVNFYSIYSPGTAILYHVGQVGFGGVIAPTADLHLGAGSATASTAPMKFTSGALLSTAEAGAQEFLTDAYYGTITTGAKRGMFSLNLSGRTVGATAAVASVLAYTVPASDESFEVSANVLVTTATTHSFTVTVAYTDEGNTARTTTLNFSTIAGVISNAAITNVAGAVPYEGVPLHIRCKGATTITVATVGTFTSVVYNVIANICPISL